MATTCAVAIKEWETQTGEVAAEAKHVALYCRVPPINRLDNTLNSLVNCERLALSTNSIDKIIPLNGMKCLKILSLGRNQIKKIERLDDVADTLEELWMSYNSISSLDGLGGLSNLRVLYLSNNKISQWSELDKIAGLMNLKDVLFVGNPIYEGLSESERRVEVLRHLPNLTKIDGDLVKPKERQDASEVAEE